MRRGELEEARLSLALFDCQDTDAAIEKLVLEQSDSNSSIVTGDVKLTKSWGCRSHARPKTQLVPLVGGKDGDCYFELDSHCVGRLSFASTPISSPLVSLSTLQAPGTELICSGGADLPCTLELRLIR